MKKQFRVKSNERFGEIIHQGKCKKNSAYVIHYLNNDENIIKVGISVSKKIGKAIIRNKIKRQIRSMLSEILDFSSKSIDIIIIVKGKYLENSYQENLKLLNNLINNITE